MTPSTRRYALAMLVVAYTFSFIDRQILAILLPAIKAEFGVDDWVLGFLAGSAFALFYATLGIPLHSASATAIRLRRLPRSASFAIGIPSVA